MHHCSDRDCGWRVYTWWRWWWRHVLRCALSLTLSLSPFLSPGLSLSARSSAQTHAVCFKYMDSVDFCSAEGVCETKTGCDMFGNICYVRQVVKLALAVGIILGVVAGTFSEKVRHCESTHAANGIGGGRERSWQREPWQPTSSPTFPAAPYLSRACVADVYTLLVGKPTDVCACVDVVH